MTIDGVAFLVKMVTGKDWLLCDSAMSALSELAEDGIHTFPNAIL